MTTQLRDRLLTLLLFAFAVAWSTTVWLTVPKGYGGIIGARAVPLWLGIGLGILAVVLFAETFFRREPQPLVAVRENSDERRHVRKAEIWAVLLVGFSFLVYTQLMEWFGFVVSTLVVVAALLRLGLGVRSVPIIAGMSLGLAFGIYVVMGVLMGIYLPHGTIVSVF
ncbi:MAG: tripartite tricarboxylate transporter TctB family protein [Gemmataceae bacterium]